MVRARLSVLFAFLALTVIVAGCGGGSSSSAVETSSGNPPGQSAEHPKEAFIEEADARCSDYQAEVAPIKAELEELEKVANPESPQNEKQLGGLLNEALAGAEAELESIRELEAPSGDQSTIEKMLGAAEEGNSLVGEAATALEEGDTQTFGELAKEGETVNARARTLAEGYGLKVCGQAP